MSASCKIRLIEFIDMLIISLPLSNNGNIFLEGCAGPSCKCLRVSRHPGKSNGVNSRRLNRHGRSGKERQSGWIDSKRCTWFIRHSRKGML